MKSLDESASRHIQEFRHRISGVDRVRLLIDYAQKNPRLVAEVYLGYYQIIKDLVRIRHTDLMTIARANEKLGKPNKVAEFQEIVAGRGEDIVTLAAKACDTKSNTYIAGIQDLTEMMKNADKIKTANPSARPVDGDPMWDTVIWGYTNGADNPATDIHFVVAHGLCRVISQEFGDRLGNLTGAEKKDWLLNAMTDIIALGGVRGVGREAKFYNQWREKRPMGLGWISDARDLAYREIISS